MLKNLLVASLISSLMMLGCKEVSNFNGSESLDHIVFDPQPFEISIPEGFPRLENPEDNPITVAGVKLGKMLFHDPLLSADSSMSCASCHLSAIAFTDGRKTSPGIDGITGKRSAMSLINVAFYNEGLFWDGRVKSLEEQALIPVEDTLELHNSWEKVVERLKGHSEYPAAFRKAFGINSIDQIDKYLAVKAIAQFERSLISGDSKFDQVMRGDAEFTQDEKMGYNIFFDENFEDPHAECGHCHNAPLMTTNEYFNNGIEAVESVEDFPDNGFGTVTKDPMDMGKFRVPSLRNIALTAPYMHDGRFETLEEVVEHYNAGGHNGPNVSPLIRPLNLDETQKRQLIAFLHTLTDRNFVASATQ